MATKKEKRARGLAKHEAFMAAYRADGLKAQAAAREQELKQEAEILRQARRENKRLQEILDLEMAILRQRAKEGDFRGMSSSEISYAQALCEEPHVDGSTCAPTWDGCIYICFTALLAETNRSMQMDYEEMMETGLRRVMETARAHPLIPGDTHRAK